MMITVFYDDKCGLCSKEIRHYQKVAPANIFDWQGISGGADRLEKANISTADALKALHAIDGAGHTHVGVDAFLLIWKQLSRWRYLALFVGLPLIKPLTELIYRVFAEWRFKKLEHCKVPQSQ